MYFIQYIVKIYTYFISIRKVIFNYCSDFFKKNIISIIVFMIIYSQLKLWIKANILNYLPIKNINKKMDKKYNMKIEIKPKPLTREAFHKFGEVIEKEGRDSMIINRGSAEKFSEVCNMDANEKGGITTLHIYIGKSRDFPLHIDMLEKHPLFSQTFIPRSKEPFYCVTALGGREPDLSTLEVFETNGDQGVHYNRGVWHFPLICIKDKEEFIVLDRAGENQEEKRIVEQIEFNMKDKEIYLIIE